MYIQTFKDVGSEWQISEDTMEKPEAFTCLMYSSKSCTDINELRYKLFYAKKGNIDSHQLPPCSDSLKKHTLRANFQAGIWRSLVPINEIPDPVGHGWEMDLEGNNSGCLVIDWMDCPIAPTAVLSLITCKCKRTCKLPECSCLANNLQCTDMCSLTTCKNQMNKEY